MKLQFVGKEILRRFSWLVLLLSLCAVFIEKPAQAESRDPLVIIADIETKLLGTPLGPYDPYTQGMLAIVQAQGLNQGALEAAAETLISHPLFIYKMKDFFAPWMNLTLSIQNVPWSKPILLLLQRALVQRDISDIFTANVTCLWSINGVMTEPGTLTEQQALTMLAGLQNPISAIVCSTGQFSYTQDNNGNPVQGTALPANQTGGIWTLGGPGTLWQAVSTGGTENRVFLQATQIMGLTINDFRSTSYSGAYAPTYVPRNPPGGPTVFEQTCKTCHGGQMSQVTTVFCNGWDVDQNQELTYNPNLSFRQTKCAGSNATQRNNPAYPGGNMMTSGVFQDVLPPSIAALSGDQVQGYSGTGVSAFGYWLSNQNTLWSNLVEAAYNGPVGVGQGIDPNHANFSNNVAQILQPKKDIAKILCDVAADTALVSH